MFASAGRAVARRLPIATGQLLPQTLVLRPALATRAFTTSHEALQPKIKASATKEGTTTKKPAAKKAKKSTASEDGESPKKRATKAKGKAKAKPQKKQLTPEQKEAAKEKAKVEKDRAKVRELKKIALLGEEPKVVKANPWTLHIEEVKNAEGEKDFKTLVLNAKDSYKNLSTSELESLKERCAKEKTKEAAEQKRWIESHSVETIYNANKARRHLKLLGKKNIKTLEDERLPKGARTPFILFGQARREELVAQNSSIPPTEIIKRISDAWHQASEAERKPFQEAYEKEKGERGKALDEVRIKARELQQAAKEAEVAENKALKAEKAERAAERRLARAAERAAERAATKST